MKATPYITAILFIAGCSSQPDKPMTAVVPSAIMPPVVPVKSFVTPVVAKVIPAPKPSPVMPDMIYPPDMASKAWYVDASTDLVHWVEIAGPFYGDHAGGTLEVKPLSPSHTFYRMRGEER